MLRLLFILGFLLSLNLVKAQQYSLHIGDTFPNFQYKGMFQKENKLNGLKGSYVLVHFWASWNSESRELQLEFIPIYSKFKEKKFNKGKKFYIVSVSLDKEEKLYELAIKKDNLPWMKLDSAQMEFAGILRETKNIYGAESKYNLALIQYHKKEYKNAQKSIYDLADQFSAYEYWVAKAYLLLADVLVKQNDFFQAKATLQSLLDNYEGQDILALTKAKMIEVIELENLQKDKQKQQIEQRIKQNENK